jgi:heme exporter protein D
MTQGVVVGGWEYVWAAYGITFAAFLIYGVTLVTKLRAERSRAAEDGTTR